MKLRPNFEILLQKHIARTMWVTQTSVVPVVHCCFLSDSPPPPHIGPRPRQVFYEVFAHRDLIVHVLDAAGRRDEQLAGLGGAIRRNALAPGEFTPLLGSGLDAEVAIAAFNAQHGD